MSRAPTKPAAAPSKPRGRNHPAVKKALAEIAELAKDGPPALPRL